MVEKYTKLLVTKLSPSTHKKLKEMARKHDVVMVSPYQTDEEGRAKFSRGLLIPPDWAFKLDAKHGERDSISFECQKSRNDAPFHFESPIDWPTLKIKPHVNYYTMDKAEKTAEIIAKAGNRKATTHSDDLSI